MRKKLATKICAIAMTAAMVASMAGCGNDSGTQDSGNASSDAPSSAEGSSSEEASGGADEGSDESSAEDEGGEEAAAAYDGGGATIRVNGGIWSPLRADNEGNPDYITKWDLANQLNAKYNINIEYVELPNDDGYSTSEAIQATITSGECFADIFTASDDVTVALRNYLVDITSFADELEMGSIYLEPATWSGHIYGFTYDNMGSVYTLVYSRDYLKSIGMDVTPTEKFLAGEWSYEDCKAYLTELKAKLPADTYPIAVHSNHWASMAPAANGAVSVDSNGGIHLADDNYIEAIEFYRELLDLGLAAPITEVERNEDGTFANYNQPYHPDNMCTATEAKSHVITMAEAWQMSDLESKLSGEWGIVPWPWGSAVTCEGDYTGLSPEYHTAQSIWTNMLVPKEEYRAADAKAIPDNILFQIAKEWCDMDNPSGAAARKAMFDAEQAGQPYENLGYTPGTMGNFSTEEDAALYDWLHSRVIVDWGHAVQELGYVRVNRNAAYIIVGGDDGRSTGESFKAEGEATMADAFK